MSQASVATGTPVSCSNSSSTSPPRVSLNDDVRVLREEITELRQRLGELETTTAAATAAAASAGAGGGAASGPAAAQGQDPARAIKFLTRGRALRNHTATLTIDDRTFTKRQCYIEAAQADPDNGDVWRDLGKIGFANLVIAGVDYSATHDNDGRTLCYEQALRCDATDSDSWTRLAKCGRFQPTVSINGARLTRVMCYARALQHDPRNLSAWYGIAGGCYRDNNCMVEINDEPLSRLDGCARIIAIAPRSEAVWRNLAKWMAGTSARLVLADGAEFKGHELAEARRHAGGGEMPVAAAGGGAGRGAGGAGRGGAGRGGGGRGRGQSSAAAAPAAGGGAGVAGRDAAVGGQSSAAAAPAAGGGAAAAAAAVGGQSSAAAAPAAGGGAGAAAAAAGQSPAAAAPAASGGATLRGGVGSRLRSRSGASPAPVVSAAAPPAADGANSGQQNQPNAGSDE